MCVVSNMGDYWKDRQWPSYPSYPNIPNPEVSREEFERLKKDIEELKQLLLAAKKYDEATNQPDCEMDDKVALIKKIADAVGVDLSEVFGKK